MENTNDQYITINLITNEHLKSIKDVDEIFRDIQMYKNQLRETRGSIRIQAHAFQTKRCCCCRDDTRSDNICQEIIKFENELFQSTSVEYVYNIDCMTNKIL